MTGAIKPVSFSQPLKREPRLSTPRAPGRRHKRYWTDEEDATIKAYYPKGGVPACQPHLPSERSPSAIYGRAFKFGLTGTGQPCHTSARGIDVPGDFDDTLRREWALLDGKKKGEVNALADRLKVPRWWLSDHICRLGLSIPHAKEPNWTDAENALMAKVPLHDPDRCAQIFRDHGFKRTPTSIVVRAKRLDLSRRTHETFSANTASKLLGVDAKWVTARCIEGHIKAGRRPSKRLPQQGGDAWAIERADLRTFIIDHLDQIDLRKVEKFGFVDLLVSIPPERLK